MLPRSQRKIKRREKSARRKFVAWLGGALGLLALSGVLVVLGGRILPSQLFVPEDLSAVNKEKPSDGKAFGSLAQALEQLDADTLRAYFDRYSNPSDAANLPPGAPVFVDAEALARLHPAWQLADEIESGRLQVPSARQLAVANLPRFVANSSFGAGSGATIDVARETSDLAVRARPAREVEAELALQNLRARERAELRDFLSDLEVRQAARVSGEEASARRALENEVALSLRRVGDEVPLSGVDADLALELTNLRLQLLEQLAVPPAEREAARAEIARIRARLAAVWAEQTRRQEAALRAALEEIPARLRGEGETRLEAEISALRARNQALQAELRREFSALLERDFEGETDRDNAVLRLLLPPAREPLVRLAPLGNGTRSRLSSSAGLSSGARNFELDAARSPSAAPPSLTGAPSGMPRADSISVSALRKQARQDAQIWARSAAARLGGTWSQNQTAPDRTAQALQLLLGDETSALQGER